MATAKKDQEISVLQVTRGRATFALRGTSPLICNAMSAKVQQELLLPAGRKNAVQKKTQLKHDPVQEFRDSMYYARDPESPTCVIMKSTAFKAALMGAALDLPGTNKRQIGRLCYVVGDEVPVFGIPELMMSVTRCADINRTPDVRTRAILPEWCAVVTIEFTEPLLKVESLINLMAAAGITQGIGDWRTEKGSGNYGGFEVVDLKDIKKLMAKCGADEQRAAIDNPVCYDSETEALMSWFDVEAKRRGFAVA